MAAENFPVALRLLPAGPRQDLARVYAYARYVDDLGDEDGAAESTADRLALLDGVEADLRGPARLPAVAGVAGLSSSGRVPLQPFLDLIEANRRDQVTSSYETYADLLEYCRYSATPVGRIVLHLAGAADPANVAASDAVCNALQVLEHCQDVGEDYARGRVYLPAGELRAAGADPASLGGASTPAAVRSVVAAQVARARAALAEGRPLVRRLHGWARFAVAGYVAGGFATADALEGARWDVLARPVRPSKPRTLRHAVALLAGAGR
jgi:squalene synthase HpnC